MNGRTVSLPDLVSEKRRNTTLSLSEGFAGARYEGSLAATAQNFVQKPQGPGEPKDDAASADMERILQLYYRNRQIVLGTEKARRRVPAKLQMDLRALEKALGKALRPVFPLFFQRFDDNQLDRLLRAMPFLRLSSGRWVFGGEQLNATWPPPSGQRSFMLFSGVVALYPDAAGAGHKTEVGRGTLFGERHFRLGDEAMADECVCGAAHCEKPSIVGVLSTDVLEAAFADRAFGNPRIVQMARHVPALSRIVQSEPGPGKVATENPRRSMSPAGTKSPEQARTAPAAGGGRDQDVNAAVMHALTDLSKTCTTIHVLPNQKVLSQESLEESVLIVSKGTLEVHGDVTLTQKLDAIPPKKVRIHVYLDKATNLAGDSIFDKLDPYCIVKIGDFKRFQTPVLWNEGPNPKFDYPGVLTLQEDRDKMLEFTVMDHDKYTADDLCGNGSISLEDLPDGWSGSVELTRPKRGMFQSEATMEEKAGRLFFSVRYDYEKVTMLTQAPKRRTWPDLELFTLKENDCWGHEPLILGPLFKKTLEQASANLDFNLTLSNFRVIGSYQGSGNEIMSAWKASGKRFLDFVSQCGKKNQFMQACRVSLLDKQHAVKALAQRLIKKWEIEEQAEMMQNGVFEAPPMEEAMDPSHFRVAYRGTRAHITVRNAVNLTGGGWFDKLDPYAVVRFRGAKQEFRTAVLQDAGADPFWDASGALTYQGEVALEMSVWDYDKYSADDLIATGVVQVGQFSGGFEGMVPLSLTTKKSKTMKQSMIIIGIQWDQPRDPNATLNTVTSLTGLKSLTQGA